MRRAPLAFAFALIAACGDAAGPAADTSVQDDVNPVDTAVHDDVNPADTSVHDDVNPGDTDTSEVPDSLDDGSDAPEPADAPDSVDAADSSDTADLADVPTLDPEGDTDRDGVMDLDEVADGTDPFDPRSARAWHPEITGHPRLFTRPERRAALAERAAATTGRDATLWARVVSTANRAVPDHPLSAGYDTSIPPAQGQIAEAAALVGFVTADLAMAHKALDILAAPFPDPTPLNQQSAFNAGDHYDLLEAEALQSMCSAWDLAAGTDGVDPDKLAAAHASLLTRVDLFRTLCMTRGGCTVLLRNEPNNHAMKALSALGTCAMALPDRPEAAVDFNEAVAALTYLAHDRQGDLEGGWAESWNYLNYSGETHLGLLTALQHTATLQRDAHPAWRVRGLGWVTGLDPDNGRVHDVPTPSNDPLWRAVYLGALFAAQPNGLTVPVDDANPSALHGGLLAALFAEPRFLWNWELPAVGQHTGRQLVATFLALDPSVEAQTPSWELDGFFADAGYSVLRSDLTTTATYLHVQHEPERMRLGGGAHEHADPLSFVLWALGEPLAIDPAYIDYTNHNKVRYGKDHNIVLVDGQGPEFFLDGLITAPPNSDGFLHDHAVGAPLTTLSASTKYADAELRRRFVRVTRPDAPPLFIVADQLVSAGARAYTFQLNGLASEEIAQTSFTLTSDALGGRATFTRPKATLHVATLSTLGAATANSRLEESALASGRHRCFTVDANMGEGAGFLTVLAPSAPDLAPTLTHDRPAERIARVTTTAGATTLIAYLNTGTSSTVPEGASTRWVPAGLTIVLDGAATTYTMELPPIPDPTPFIPE